MRIVRLARSAFVLCLLAFSASSAFAADFTVTMTSDRAGVCNVGDCSLREAIMAANASPGSTIILGNGQTYTLTIGPPDAPGALVAASGDLDITQALTIDGHGSIIDATGLADRVLDIQGSFLVTLNDLTIEGGIASGLLSSGGGLSIRGATVVLNNCVVTANGTALDAPSGWRGDGGGIAVSGSFDAPSGVTTLASLTLNNSTVSTNSALNGGGIACVLCALTISNSTIAGNASIGGEGGGVDVVGNASTVSVTSSTFASNTSSTQGAGLSVPFGTSVSTLSRSRIVSNTASIASAVFDHVGTVTATNNWWGCNFGPGAGGGGCVGLTNGVSGAIDTTPYLVLSGTVSPPTIVPNAASAMTANLTSNSASSDTSSGGTLPDGIVAAFSGSLGTFATPTSTTVSGKATDIYTNNGTPGVASLSTVVDAQTVSVPLTINSAPTIAPIGDQTTNEDTPTAAIAFTVGDAETPAASLTLSGLSSNLTLVPNANITFGGGGAGRTVTVTPAADQSGTATITVTVSDGTSTASRSFLLTVTAVNDPPTLDAIPDPPAINEDAGLQTVNLTGISAGGGETQTLTLTALSNNTALIPNPTVSYTSPNATGSLSYTPVANANGSAIITVTVTDNGGGTNTFSRTFTVNVTAVNDAPTLNAIPDPPAILEDAGLQTVNLSGISAGGGETQTMTVTALSNNTGLIPNPTVSYTSPNPTGSLSYTPVANANGSAIITVTVTDNGGGTNTFSRTFTVNVTPVNDLPTISDITDRAVPASTTVSIPFTVGDLETAPAALVVTASSSNQAVVANAGLVVSAGGVSRTLTLTPVPNQVGVSTITVTVDDGTGGLTSDTFVVTVVAALSINDASVVEGNSGATTMTFTIALAGPSAVPVSVHYATEQRTAIDGVDYVGVSGNVSFAPGVTGPQTFTVTVNGETKTEIDETFVVNLTSPVGTVVARSQGVGTITNDDPTSPQTAELVAWARKVGVTADGGSLTKTAPIGWTAGANSTKALKIGDGSVEFSAVTATQENIVGLKRAFTSIGLSTIDYAIQLHESGLFDILENGTYPTSTFGPCAAADRFGITVTGLVVTYQRNGVTFYTSSVPVQYPLRVDAAVYTPGATIRDVVLAGRLVRIGGPAGDFDGDGRSDATVFRPSTGNWMTLNSSTAYGTSTSHAWGLSTDVPVPGDYDGDGKIDPAVFRASTGGWHILKSSTNYTTSVSVLWGLSTDTPMPGDYDGDGKTDPAVYRPSTGKWHVLLSSTNYTSSVSYAWGLSTDVPMPGDYDGDGLADPAVFRPSTGGWFALKSSTNYTTSIGVLWGLSTDVPVPGDYDGDGKVDPAVYRPSTGGWYVLKSSANFTTSFGVSWGLSTDLPVPADYDGDGKFDPAVFRPSTGGWYVLKSSTNYTTSIGLLWGLATDAPINKRP